MSSPFPEFYGGDPWYATFGFLLAFTIFLVIPFAGVYVYGRVKDRAGYQWLATNTEKTALVLTWLNHAARVEALSHRNSLIRAESVAAFFVAENETECVELARSSNAGYVLVAYPSDLYTFRLMALAAGRNPADFIAANLTTEQIGRREVVKRETVGIKMIYGEEIEGFEKVFDNRRIRIYKLVVVPVMDYPLTTRTINTPSIPA
jgi:hypothetical protein